MTDLASSLPCYAHVLAWLGSPESGWTMVDGHGEPMPEEFRAGSILFVEGQRSPWLISESGFVCFLRHSDGTRVTVRAPERPMWPFRWELWFCLIARRDIGSGEYREHVTWQHCRDAEASA